jgi:hypothetical protein
MVYSPQLNKNYIILKEIIIVIGYYIHKQIASTLSIYISTPTYFSLM